MIDQEYPKSRKRNRMHLMIALLVVLLVGTFCICVAWYRPRVFSFQANVSSVGGNVSGEVFKSSDGIFLVRLNSGSQLTVQVNPPKVFLSPISSPSGFRVGSYLLVPAASVGGVDLSKSESFDRQLPVIGEGQIIVKDPKQRDGEFSFPIGS